MEKMLTQEEFDSKIKEVLITKEEIAKAIAVCFDGRYALLLLIFEKRRLSIFAFL